MQRAMIGSGTSGGIRGLESGYCHMVGGSDSAVTCGGDHAVKTS